MTGKDNLMFLMNGTLYIPAGRTGALLDDNTALNNFYKLDLTTGDFSKDYNRPDIYNKGNWGANCMMELSYSTINRKDNFIIRSIPVDADIYVYQNDQLVEKHQIKSKYFDEVPPMSLNRDKEMDWKNRWSTIIQPPTISISFMMNTEMSTIDLPYLETR